MDGGDVPDAGDDEDHVGGPGQAGERPGQDLGGVAAQRPGRADEARHHDLAAHPHRRGQDVEGEADGVERRRQHDARYLPCQFGGALLGEGDGALHGVGRGEHDADGLRVDLPALGLGHLGGRFITLFE